MRRALLQIPAVSAMTAPVANPPRVGDIVHYWPLTAEMPGCRAAVVTEIHMDPQLASLMVLHTTGIQFILEARVSLVEHDPFTDRYEPGTWHSADHQ